jgi:hypothetical protein
LCTVQRRQQRHRRHGEKKTCPQREQNISRHENAVEWMLCS